MIHLGKFVPFFILITISCSGSAPPPEIDPTSLRRPPAGPVEGFASPVADAHVWLGIPFAQPPVGELRWRAPRPHEPWVEPLQAIRHAMPCTQFDPLTAPNAKAQDAKLYGGEDCLSLDIYAPRWLPEAVPSDLLRLPVMVWIHGGGNHQGEASLYDGATLAASRDVIVVTLQYRLGAFGWFSHRALRGEGTSADDRSGNYGTLDQIRVLEWVRDNIAAFGGDPGRITIFGESAGGSNVLALLRSPRAAGLFQRAIAQSGIARGRTLAQAENLVDAPTPGLPFSSSEVLLRIFQREGAAADREAALGVLAEMSDAEIAKTLRSQSARDLITAYEIKNIGGIYDAPALLRDGNVLAREAPLEAYEIGNYNQVPVIAGTNRDEVKLFMLFGSPHMRRVLSVPVAVKNERMYNVTANYPSLMWKALGVDEPVTAMRRVQGASVFAYRFDWDGEREPLWLDLGTWLGAGHAMEVPFVFGRLSLGPATRIVFDPSRREADEALSRAMTSYWTQFAYAGSPGRGREGELPFWEPWRPGGGSFLVLDVADEGRMHMSEETVTRADVIAAVAIDPRLETREERCEVYALLAKRSSGMTAGEYAAVEDGRCPALPDS